MRANLGGIAALCVGACFVLSCAGGGGPDESEDSPDVVVGAKGGANGAAGPTSGGGAGQAGGGSTGPAADAGTAPAADSGAAPAVGGSTGQAGSSAPPAVSGTAGQPAAGGAAPAAGGSTGQAGSSAPPAVSGAAGQPVSGTAGQPVTGGAGPAVGGAAGATAPPATSAAATIVPLYTSPGDASWNTVIAAKMAHPKVGVVAIVNPNNGPGSAVSSAYTSGIARLTAAGIKVIGYVSTDYTRNSAATVKADIDRWRTFYPGQLGGIFFDEQSNQADDVAYYRDLSQYAKAQGLSFTVGNPGTDTAEAYVGALDMMLIYETGGLPSTDKLAGWHANHAPSNFGIIPYAASLSTTFVRDARKYVHYIYVQSDNLPNPWDSVPSYFGDLLAALE